MSAIVSVVDLGGGKYSVLLGGQAGGMSSEIHTADSALSRVASVLSSQVPGSTFLRPISREDYIALAEGYVDVAFDPERVVETSRDLMGFNDATYAATVASGTIPTA